jgi:hypothetical protein
MIVPGGKVDCARAVVVEPIRVTTSRAEHLRKTSPTNSRGGAEASGGGVVADGGKCHGEEKVSVRARCCSAIVRREIL